MFTNLQYQYFLLPLLCPASSGSSAPHIIVFLADDLGYNDISWHNPHVLTPHIQDLATSGVILEQHYSQPICSPTRGALLTGRYPIHNGLHNGVITPLTPYGLDDQLTLLPQELKRLINLIYGDNYCLLCKGWICLSYCW